jgi:hypothetical protein
LTVLIDNKKDNIYSAIVSRLYERYPWELVNYVKVKEGRFGFFAVPYVNYNISSQFLAVYDTSFNAKSYLLEQGSGLEVVRILGAHWVRDTFEVSFDFNQTNGFDYDNIMFVDVDGFNIT